MRPSLADPTKTPPGLTGTPESEWPKIPASAAQELPIDRLKPGSDLHQKVLTYFLDKLQMSERKMQNFYSRWRVAERRCQAYIDLNDYEKLLKQQNDEGKEPKAISIAVPYCFATQATIVTYLVHTFLGRKPIFQIANYKGELAGAAEKMEIVLQYNSDATRLQKHLFQFFNDGEMYGLGVLRTAWKEDRQLRTIWKPPAPGLIGAALLKAGMGNRRVREERLVYQGNAVATIDPFMFFPDPRVPMCDVNRRGEFVIWRSFEGRHTLKKEEAAGNFKWVDYIPNLPRANTKVDGSDGEASARSVLSGGDPNPGLANNTATLGQNYSQIDQGTFDLVPAELGLSPSKKIEKWLLACGNKGQIIQARPFDADHSMHPVAVTEPYGLGYGFGQPSLHDYAGDMQDTMSWFINSHIHNVRTALNNMFVVDPSRIEMQDLKNPKPGKLIRLKRAAYGQDVGTALQQLTTSDVTKSHVNDMQLFMRLGDTLAAVNDNIRGLQDAGGRKTATEVRTSGEAAASRLAAHCRLISAQAVVDLTEQMSVNLQQYLDDEFYIQIVGEEGRMVPLKISPDQLSGDFQYPVNDGTLPLDKVALLDVWTRLMEGVAADQELRGEYSLPKMFEWVAELGGARNIQSFKKVQPNVTVAPDAELEAQAQAGNMVQMGGQTPGLEGPPPGNRLVQ